jgi:hypothetical protein
VNKPFVPLVERDAHKRYPLDTRPSKGRIEPPLSGNRPVASLKEDFRGEL